MNKKLKCTPGPWSASIAGPGESIHIYKPMLDETISTGYEGAIIAEIGNHSNYNEANAVLIAAAPELRDACEAALSELGWALECKERNQVYNLLKKILAKVDSEE